MGIVGLTLLIIVVTASALLGLWILLSNRKSKINLWFFVISATILLWNIFAYLGYQATDAETAVSFFRYNFASVSLYFIAFYFFTLYFPIDSSKRFFFLDFLITLIGASFTVISLFTNQIIQDVSIPEKGKLIMHLGGLGNVFYLFTILLTAYILYTLFKKNAQLSDINKFRIKYFLIGTIIYALLNIVFSIGVSFLYPQNYNYTQLGDFSAITFLGFTAYAIMKHQLFNIKLIATESIVILLSLILFVQIFISNTISEGVINAIIWVLASYGGYQLVRSVKREIRQREEIAKLAKDLEKANEHLKEVDKLKDDFLSMASHELNTPIAAIQGYLSMILVEGLGGKIPDKARTFLNSVFESAKRLGNMVKDLLNVSRIESGRIHIIWDQKPVEDVINQAITEVMSKALEAHHTLTFEKPKHKMPLTWFDTTRITEIMINILGNAIKYTPNGGKIVAKVMNDDQKIVVSVQDNGKGIPKDKFNCVFEKFTQVDVLKDEVKGTGLGMYISKKFIELQKGKIWFTSDGASKGSTFYFSLPILKSKPYDPHDGEDAVLH